MTTERVPKAILYSWPTSVWSTVPLLCLHEKGYSPDEYIVKQVDITKGENFSPSYLKINMNGTIPTLVVPTIETTGSEVDSRYRSLRDTITICDFLDQARGANTQHTTSDRPAPALAPATIEGKTISDTLIALCHLPTTDPNFCFISCLDHAQLQEKLHSFPGAYLNDRHLALQRYIEEAKASAVEAGGGTEGKLTWEQKIVAFLEEKKAANEMLWEVYNGKAGEEKEKAFFKASKAVWAEGVPDVMGKLESTIKGPYALGDQVSLADFHLISWLARLVAVAGGNADAAGIDALELRMEGKKIGPKMRRFWTKWIERESFKKAYPDGLH
ncbi:hypothetical protein P7C73_g1600, partial [Tremellales sp. Uapishka_1]